MQEVNITVSGIIWFILWLFTVGYAKLGFWGGAFAIIIWPYFLGVALAP